jgi:hypothetical protein
VLVGVHAGPASIEGSVGEVGNDDEASDGQADGTADVEVGVSGVPGGTSAESRGRKADLEPERGASADRKSARTERPTILSALVSEGAECGL